MGWMALALVAGLAGIALWLSGVPRAMWTFVGAALMLGAAGYALQGSPAQPGKPVKAADRQIMVEPEIVALRDTLFGRFQADGAYLIAADAMTRSGDTANAVNAIIGGIRKYPKSAALWTGLGTALAVHDNDQMSPAALFAFGNAAQLAPQHPGPPFFAGLSYARGGQFRAARTQWANALALCPPEASYRREIADRLALLDQVIAQAEAQGQPIQ